MPPPQNMSRYRIWKNPSRTTFFAWLDFCVENSMQPANDSFCDPLQETTGIKFKSSQIAQRFFKLAQDEKIQKISGSDLRAQGTQCLSNISAEERRLIQELSTKFRDLYPELVKETNARDLSDDTMISRDAVLSNIRNWIQEKIPQFEFRDNGKEVGIKRKCPEEETQAKDPGEADHQPAKGIHTREAAGGSDKVTIGTRDRSKKRTRKSFEEQGFDPYQPQQHNGQQLPLIKISAVHSTFPGDSQTAPSANTAASISAGHIPQVTKLILRKRTPLERRLISEAKQKEFEIREIRHQWDQETQKTLQREKAQNSIIQGLRRDNTHLEIARDERRKAGKNTLEDVLYLKNWEMFKLSKRVKEMNELAQFTRVDHMKHEISWGEVISAMNQLSLELELLLPGHDQGEPLLVPAAVDGSELAKLIRCILGNGTEGTKERSTLRCWVAKYEPEIVLRSLIVAAVQEWVFLSQFPALDPNNLPLLRAYRETVHTFDGWESLRNLDLAAHHKLVSSGSFGKTAISRKADELACRLSRTLAPLFIIPGSEQPNRAFESWGEQEDAAKTRRCKFQNIFEAVLSLKAKTLLSNDRYGFKVHQPGTHASSDQQDSGFWLLAIVYMYSSDKVGGEDELDDALVDSRTFLGQLPLGKEPKHSSMLLIQKRDSRPTIFDRPQIESQVTDVVDVADVPPGQPQTRQACPKCRKDFAKLTDLQGHQENRLCGKCGRCNRLFRDLKVHALKEHDEDLELPIDPCFNTSTAMAKGKPTKSGRSNGPRSRKESDESESSDSSEILEDSDQSYGKISRPKSKQTRRKNVLPEEPMTRGVDEKSDKSPQLTCALCLKQFSRTGNLRAHERKENCRGCPHWEQKVHGSTALREHILEKHPQIVGENVREGSLHLSNPIQEQHVQIEEQAKSRPEKVVAEDVEDVIYIDWSCDVCQRPFSSHKNLKIHQSRVHRTKENGPNSRQNIEESPAPREEIHEKEANVAEDDEARHMALTLLKGTK